MSATSSPSSRPTRAPTPSRSRYAKRSLTDPKFVERRPSDRRQDERERQRLFEELVAAEQDERRRIALFLHDGPVQALAGIALMLDAVGHAIEDGRLEEAREVLGSALQRHRQVIQALRDLSFNLEPVVLRGRGRVAAGAGLAGRDKPLSGHVAVERTDAGTTVRVTLPEYAAAH